MIKLSWQFLILGRFRSNVNMHLAENFFIPVLVFGHSLRESSFKVSGPRLNSIIQLCTVVNEENSPKVFILFLGIAFVFQHLCSKYLNSECLIFSKFTKLIALNSSIQFKFNFIKFIKLTSLNVNIWHLCTKQPVPFITYILLNLMLPLVFHFKNLSNDPVLIIGGY